jgi:hypothetical protein
MPERSPGSTLRNAWHGSDLLKWVSICGAALTVFSNTQTILDFADWCRWLALHWQEVTYTAWSWLLSRIGISIPTEVAQLLTASFFLAMLGVSALRPFTSEATVAARYEAHWWLAWYGAGLFSLGWLALFSGHLSRDAGPWLARSTGLPPWLAGVLTAAFALGPFLVVIAVARRQSVFHFALILRRAAVVIGLTVLLMALNELSKLGLSMKAPL